MYKKLLFIFMVCGLCIVMTACGPSDEKVEEAQQKYMELLEMHNQTVEMHKNIADNSLDMTLIELREKIAEIENYDLMKMKDEEIDILIQIMDALIVSYKDLSSELAEIKGKEDAAVRIPISLSITNQTDFSFTELKLYESGDAGGHENVLAGLGDYSVGETLTGLVILRDVNNTPWILELKDENGVSYEFNLLVENYDEDGVKLNLGYDTEKKEITLNL